MADGTIDIELTVDGSKAVSDAKSEGQKIGKQASAGIDEASSKADGFTGALGKIGGAAGTMAVAVAGASAAAGAAIAKASLDGYASWEQNVGGIKKLFGDAAGQVTADANAAWVTTGQSANQYMEQVTSFSASLISSLGGDTQKAASYANTAMVDMSDNANTFGTSIGDIQNAYQGFAKQNYTMLDNLKLGYGGTQSEMQRLVKDAAAINPAIDANSLAFDNVVMAIHTMQESMGIAGTTSKEAMGTIEGSVNATKAAWDNWIVSLAGGGESLDAATQSLITGIGAVASNVGTVLLNVSEQLATTIPEIVGNAASALTANSGTFLQGIVTFFGNIGTGALIVAPQLISVILTLVQQIVAAIVANGPQIFAAAGTLFGQLAMGLSAVLPQILAGVLQLVIQLVTYLVANAPQILAGALQFFVNILTGLINAAPSILSGLATLVGQLLSSLATLAPQILPLALTAFLQILQAVWDNLPGIVGGVASIVSGILGGLAALPGQLLSSAATAFQNFINGMTSKEGGITGFVSGIPGKITGALGNVGQLLWNAGSSIIDGFLSGLKSSWGNVTDFVGGIADWIAENKGPLPYDYRLLQPAGHAIMGGFRDALSESFDSIKRDVRGYGESLQGAFAVKLQTNFSPTVTGCGGPQQVVQTINFNTPVATPDVVAQQMKSIYHYGLAADYR